MLNEMKNILGKFSDIKVFVYGDLIIDEFVKGAVNRISPEAPVPVVAVRDTDFAAGGAGNVARNLSSLGIQTYISGVIGSDFWGEQLKSILESEKVDANLCLEDKARHTILKQRIIAHSQQVVRVDYETVNPISGSMEKNIISQIDKIKDEIDAFIVSDYGKGAVTPTILTYFAKLKKSGKIVVIDPKQRNFNNYSNITAVTPNEAEAVAASNIIISDDKSLKRAGEILLKRWNCDILLVTRGAKGMSLFLNDGTMSNIKTFSQEVYDVTGAGDTVIALFSVGLACGASANAAAILANTAAGVVVAKMGTAVLNKKELNEALLHWSPEF